MRIRILIVLLLFSAVLLAQNKSVMKLDLKKSIEIALENNHDFNQTKLDLEKAKEQVKQAYGSALFPSVDGNINYNRAIKKSVFTIETPFFSGSFPTGSDNTLTGSINVNQPIFRGAMFLAIRIAETFEQISEENTQQGKLQIILQVKQAYYTHLVAKELVKLANLQYDLAKNNYDNTKSMFDAGLVSDYDLSKANVQLKNSIPAKSEARNQLRLSENNLKLILGINIDDNIQVNDSLKYEDEELPDFSEGLKRMYVKNKLLKQMELQTRMQDFNISYEFSKHLPEINAFGTLQTQAQEDDPRNFGSWRYVNSVYVGLSLKIPIFKGFTINSQVELAELDYKKSIEGLAKTKKSLRTDYENVISQIKIASEKILAYQESVKETEKGFEIASKRFNAGLGTQIEVTNSMIGLTSAKVNYLSSLQEYYLLHAQLDLLLGKSYDELNFN